MNLEKLGLILFIKYVRQFELVKQHLTNSLKELLLAASSTLDITSQITTSTVILKRIPTLEGTFRRISSLLQYSVDQLEGPQPLKAGIKEEKIKQNIVETIVTVIDEEIEQLIDSNMTNKDLKIEALTTVKKVLYRHLDGAMPVDVDYLAMEETVNT